MNYNNNFGHSNGDDRYNKINYAGYGNQPQYLSQDLTDISANSLFQTSSDFLTEQYDFSNSSFGACSPENNFSGQAAFSSTGVSEEAGFSGAEPNGSSQQSGRRKKTQAEKNEAARNNRARRKQQLHDAHQCLNIEREKNKMLLQTEKELRERRNQMKESLGVLVRCVARDNHQF